MNYPILIGYLTTLALYALCISQISLLIFLLFSCVLYNSMGDVGFPSVSCVGYYFSSALGVAVQRLHSRGLPIQMWIRSFRCLRSQAVHVCMQRTRWCEAFNNNKSSCWILSFKSSNHRISDRLIFSYLFLSPLALFFQRVDEKKTHALHWSSRLQLQGHGEDTRQTDVDTDGSWSGTRCEGIVRWCQVFSHRFRSPFDSKM